MALERNFDDPRPYIEKANPEHPSLVDRRYVTTDLYNIENVPTALWIDERRRIVRPNDVVFGSSSFQLLSNVGSQEHIDALKRWVRSNGEASDYVISDSERNEYDSRPTAEQREARTELQLAQWLRENSYTELADRHYEKACELAPDDVAVRRGTMRMRDKNPMGFGFVSMFVERLWKGLGYYNPITRSS